MATCIWERALGENVASLCLLHFYQASVDIVIISLIQLNSAVIKGADISVSVSIFVLRKLGNFARKITGFMSDILVLQRPVVRPVDLAELLLHVHEGGERWPRSAACG